MTTLSQFTLFAAYNQLMNQRIFTAAEQLTSAQLSLDRGAFFKSVLGTLNHILVGDIIWLKRFAAHASSGQALSNISGLAKPTSLDAMLFDDIYELKTERENIDNIIINWISQLTEADINECITCTSMAGKSFTKPYVSLISHLFLHQVHHRGQATTLLSQFGVDFGETDIIEIVQECDV